MCGIAGFWGGEFDPGIADRMSDRLNSRGPDGSGTWINQSQSIALAHRRLSIVDLSEAGAQPMKSPCGRFVLVFNGEIYNHLAIRRSLEDCGASYEWRGHSDTETLLAALAHWGVEECLKKLIGMFAFAFWDNVEDQLVLARDRMGEKPLYYGMLGTAFVFASELKAFNEHPKWTGIIDRNALRMFIKSSYIPSPWSIFEGVYKLPPAHFLTVNNRHDLKMVKKCYWSLPTIAREGVASDIDPDPSIMLGVLGKLTNDAVLKQMNADVPLGVLLSGGVDSALIASLMQNQSATPIKSFTIGFNESDFNEAPYAAQIAKHLGTDHTEIYVSPEDAMSVVHRLPNVYDEPFADASQIPTLLVCEAARKSVKVCLTGDGGDELFCGYNRYADGLRTWELANRLPVSANEAVSAILKRLSGSRIDTLQKYLPAKFRVPMFTNRLAKLADVIVQRDRLSYYNSVVSHCSDPADFVIGGAESKSTHDTEHNKLDSSFQDQMMLWDMMSYLPDDVLAKVDRASMSVSLETRVPLLDHRIVEFAWKVPLNLKYRNNQGKWLLRQLLYQYVPKELMDRPKSGFGIPVAQWLRGPLRDWAESQLSADRLQTEGFFDCNLVQKLWFEHKTGMRNWQYILWNVLMFQVWLAGQKG